MGTPPQLATRLTNVSHGVFVSGMTQAFLAAGIVAVAGAAIGLLTRRGRPDAEPSPASGQTAEPALSAPEAGPALAAAPATAEEEAASGPHGAGPTANDKAAASRGRWDVPPV